MTQKEWPYTQLGCTIAKGKEAYDQVEKLRKMLRATLGREPDEAYFAVMQNNGCRGLVCYYDPAIEPAMIYALSAEALAPELWTVIQHSNGKVNGVLVK